MDIVLLVYMWSFCTYPMHSHGYMLPSVVIVCFFLKRMVHIPYIQSNVPQSVVCKHFFGKNPKQSESLHVVVRPVSVRRLFTPQWKRTMEILRATSGPAVRSAKVRCWEFHIWILVYLGSGAGGGCRGKGVLPCQQDEYKKAENQLQKLITKNHKDRISKWLGWFATRLAGNWPIFQESQFTTVNLIVANDMKGT